MTVHTVTANDKLAVLHLLNKFTGYPITINGDPYPNPKKGKMDMYFPYVYTKDGENVLGSRLSQGGFENNFKYPEDIKEIMEFLITPPKEYIVKSVAGLNDAMVTKDGIKVGCQTVSFEKFQELVDKVEEFKADKN